MLVQTGDQIHTPPNGTGYAFDNPNVEGDTLNNGQPDIGQFFLTNQDHHNGPTSPLELTYSTPSAFASGMLLDIDGNEKWTVEAFDTNGNPILVNGKTLQTFTAGDKGTGNGVRHVLALRTLHHGHHWADRNHVYGLDLRTRSRLR